MGSSLKRIHKMLKVNGNQSKKLIAYHAYLMGLGDSGITSPEVKELVEEVLVVLSYHGRRKSEPNKRDCP